MLKFRDPEGQAWEVVVGRESWGAFYALFVPAGIDTSRSVRQALLRAATYEAAMLEIDHGGPDALEALFLASVPKTS